MECIFQVALASLLGATVTSSKPYGGRCCINELSGVMVGEESDFLVANVAGTPAIGPPSWVASVRYYEQPRNHNLDLSTPFPYTLFLGHSTRSPTEASQPGPPHSFYIPLFRRNLHDRYSCLLLGLGGSRQL